MKIPSLSLFVASLICVPLNAATIDLDAQGVSAPSGFNGVPNSPLVIGIATFAGGQILNKEANGADFSAVYATATFGKLSDPLTITFSEPVSGFSLLITNEVADIYQVSDNKDGSKSLAVNQNMSQLFNLSDMGITSITIVSTITAPFWNFAIDDVTFTRAMAAEAPEPGTMAFAGILLVCLTFLRWLSARLPDGR